MENVSCSTSYFATADFLSFVLHRIIIFEVPTHVFGAYIIVFKTPAQMSSVKWQMLNLHFWSALLDLFFGTLTNPFVTFPFLAGNAVGLLSLLNVDTAIQVYLAISIIGIVFATLVSFFENRYHILSRHKNVWTRVRIPALISNHVFMVVFLLPFLFLIPDQGYAVPIVTRQFPCFNLYAPGVKMFVFSLDPLPLVLLMVPLFIGQMLIIVFFVTITLRALTEQTRLKTTSQKTIALQRKFLYCLIAQTSIIMAALYLPMLYMSYSNVMKYHNQVLNNSAFILLALHGFLSTIVLLSIHRPYRIATINILAFWKKWKKPESTVVTHVST